MRLPKLRLRKYWDVALYGVLNGGMLELLSANIRGFEPAGPGPAATSAAILVMYNSAVRTREGCSSSRVSFGLMT